MDGAKTPVWVAVDGRLAGLLAIAGSSEPVAAQAIAALHRLGLQVVMITGDSLAHRRMPWPAEWGSMWCAPSAAR